MGVADLIGRAKARVTRSHVYAALPDGTDPSQRLVPSDAGTGRKRSKLKRVVAALVMVAIFAFFTRRSYESGSGSGSCDSVKRGFSCEPTIARFWGQYTPFFSVPSEISPLVPEHCHVTFAQVLSRHGARDPTLGKSVTYGALVEHIHSSVTQYGPGYEFVRDFNYELGADELSEFGERQMVNSGINFYRRYSDLARTKSPFVRSAGQHRVVVSAYNWTQGFHDSRVADQGAGRADDHPYDILVIPEGSGINNTLSHQLCTKFEDGDRGDDRHSAQETWRAIFAPKITKRLNENMPRANLSDEDTIQFMELCPFDTVAKKDGKLSPFCNLFTEEEWHEYDYYESLGKWYGHGNGHPLGSTQGVGFVNELIARLVSWPVEDNTSTNSTLDRNDATFPLDRALYADFSHDNDMAGIYAALGLYNATEPLSNSTAQSPVKTNGYSASWAVPFAARMYVEKLSCQGFNEEHVRVLVNDRVIPLQNCGVDEFGRCLVSKFVSSLSFARAGGYWDQCFEPDSVAPTSIPL